MKYDNNGPSTLQNINFNTYTYSIQYNTILSKCIYLYISCMLYEIVYNTFLAGYLQAHACVWGWCPARRVRDPPPPVSPTAGRETSSNLPILRKL